MSDATPDQPRTIRIAIAQASDGATRVCGPDDLESGSYSDQMDAAICWLLEAGHTVVAHFWIEASLPAPKSAAINLGAATLTREGPSQ